MDSNHSLILDSQWHYVCKANRDNFLYDLSHIDGESMQYTQERILQYNDAGLSIFYKPEMIEVAGQTTIDNQDLHRDFLNKQTELVRKLSFTLQLSDPDDYEGGNVELINEANENYIAPRERGTMILFDSRTQHRVIKLQKELVDLSLVGYAPRWR